MGDVALDEVAAARQGELDAKIRMANAVNAARRAGWTWVDIARAASMAPQSVHERFGKLADA